MSDLVEVRKIKDGFNGLFSKNFIPKGLAILNLGKAKHDIPTRTSIQIQEKHVEHSLGAYINHNCRPSSFVNSDESQIVAKEDIHPNVEITIDYLETESMLAEPFYCNCCDNKLISGKD